MLPYVVTVIGVSVSAALSSFVVRSLGDQPGRRAGARKLWTPFDFITVAVLVTFSALRYQVGTDYAMYLRYFDLINPRDDWWVQIDQFQQEIGYTLVALIVRSFTDAPFAIFWVTSALTIIPVYAAIKRQSNDLTMSVMLYVLLAFYVGPFNIVRQGIAIAFNFWAYQFLGRRNWLFVLLNTVAALFHLSALLAAIVQLVARLWKPSTRATVLALSGGVVVALAIWATPFVSGILESLNPRYGGYIAQSEGAGFGTYLLIGANFAFVLLLLRNRDHVGRTDWLAFLIVGVFFLILGTQAEVAARMFYYFGIFAVLALPNMLQSRPNSGVLKGAILAGSAVYFVLYLQNYGSLLPYQTYL